MSSSSAVRLVRDRVEGRLATGQASLYRQVAGRHGLFALLAG